MHMQPIRKQHSSAGRGKSTLRPIGNAASGLPAALEPRHCVFRSVSRLARAVSSTYDAALKPCGLSAGQFTTLMTLSRSGPSTVGELARLITASSTTIPRILQPLQDRQLVCAVEAEDRRKRIVAVTPAGERLLRKALPHWERGQREVLDHFDAERWARLRSEIAALRRSLDA